MSSRHLTSANHSNYLSDMERIPIEDEYSDVLSKALQGHGWSAEELARRAGVSENNVAAVLGGHFDPNIAEQLAGALGLRTAALCALARAEWYPEVTMPLGMTMHTSHYGSMLVNAYLLWDPTSDQAALFDTGADVQPLLDQAGEHQLKIAYLFLTHEHADHFDDLEKVLEQTDAETWIATAGGMPELSRFEWGHTFSVGNLKVETRRTTGHSRGGTTYVVTGLEKDIAIVGDAVFAGSMGGPKLDYAEALRTNDESIYSLPDTTIIAPGHGPLTTVGDEKRWNPFYDASQPQGDS